jgi:dynein assembly factor with WDR repeat domains 1
MDSITVREASNNSQCFLWHQYNSGKCVETLQGHSDEVLDVCFNATGNRLASASADATARIYNVHTGKRIHTVHTGKEGSEIR